MSDLAIHEPVAGSSVPRRFSPQTGEQAAAAGAPAPATVSLPASRKRLTLLATILGSSIAILDSSVVGVALPSIQRDLGGGLAGQQWVTNAYLLMLGSLILRGAASMWSAPCCASWASAVSCSP